MKLQVLLSMNGGLPHEGPKVTPDHDEAQATYREFCKSLGLPEDDPHDSESDVFWWEVEVSGDANEITPWR